MSTHHVANFPSGCPPAEKKDEGKGDSVGNDGPSHKVPYVKVSTIEVPDDEFDSMDIDGWCNEDPEAELEEGTMPVEELKNLQHDRSELKKKL